MLEHHQAAWNGRKDAQDVAEPVSDESVYDLYGNVAEWVSDWEDLHPYPPFCADPSGRTDPKGPPHGTRKLVMGGSFKAMAGARYAEDRSESPTAKPIDVGFRCAADAKNE